MKASELITIMRAGVDNAREQGVLNFTIDNISDWVGRLGKLVAEAEEEQEEDVKAKTERYYKVDIPGSLESVKFQNAAQLEVFKGALKFGEIALGSIPFLVEIEQSLTPRATHCFWS